MAGKQQVKPHLQIAEHGVVNRRIFISLQMDRETPWVWNCPITSGQLQPSKGAVSVLWLAALSEVSVEEYTLHASS